MQLAAEVSGFKHAFLQGVLPGLVVAGGRAHDGGPKKVALTFDDGPWPEQTEEILRMLEGVGAKATFFMLGSSVKLWPSLAREVVSRGMLVGNHGATHRDLRWLSPRETASEIGSSADLIAETTAVYPRWFRPAYGKLSIPALVLLRRLEMRSALWTVDSGDCLRPPFEQIAEDVLSKVRPGSVVLMHDGGESRDMTLQALPLILEELRGRDYSFVTLDDL
jgi:peptidoglycan-N-acetylglucosamine deacetylase